MVHPADPAENTSSASPADAESVDPSTVPPAIDDDADVVDAEIVESGPPVSPSAPFPAGNYRNYPDYTEAGVPSLDYVRNKIEGRYATAIGSTELAQEAADREVERRAAAEKEEALTAEAQRVAREQAAQDKLEEIRRSLHP